MTPRERSILIGIATVIVVVFMVAMLVWSNQNATQARNEQAARNQALLEQVEQTRQAKD